MLKRYISILVCLVLIIVSLNSFYLMAQNQEQTNSDTQFTGYRRGVNMSCAESTGGPGVTVPGTPGKNYAYVTENAYKYFAEKGMDIFRVPFLWERIQPELQGELDDYNLNSLKNSALWAKKYGGQIILDVHNYNAYYGNAVGSNEVSVEDFIDLWIRLSDGIRADLIFQRIWKSVQKILWHFLLKQHTSERKIARFHKKSL